MNSATPDYVDQIDYSQPSPAKRNPNGFARLTSALKAIAPYTSARNQQRDAGGTEDASNPGDAGFGFDLLHNSSLYTDWQPPTYDWQKYEPPPSNPLTSGYKPRPYACAYSPSPFVLNL